MRKTKKQEQNRWEIPESVHCHAIIYRTSEFMESSDDDDDRRTAQIIIEHIQTAQKLIKELKDRQTPENDQKGER